MSVKELKDTIEPAWRNKPVVEKAATTMLAVIALIGLGQTVLER